MLENATKNIETVLMSRADFHPFPKYGEPGWDELPQETRRKLIELAEPLNEKPWLALPAVRYMDFAKNGDRARFEAVHFEARGRLKALVVAECAEHKGRFVDQIINGIWAICEETTWALPAHIGKGQDPNDALVDVEKDRVTLDLFAAETGAKLAWIYYLCGDMLRGVCREVPDRILYEIERRIIDPFLQSDDMFWMGLSDNRPVNNWNPWINGNVLSALLVACRDDQRRIEGIKKVGRSAQRFLHFYAEDGGCYEGPSYFTAAGAAMMDLLEQLYLATDGQVNLYGQKLIRNMADYIRQVHIAGDYFVNFADAASSIGSVSEELLMRVALKTDNRPLYDFGRMRLADHGGFRPERYFVSLEGSFMFRALRALFDCAGEPLRDAAPVASPGHWFGGIQVATARTRENDFDGLFLAAKGGTNAESHNHNDIGNYIIYAGGRPAVVDAGVGVYTKKTFSPQRYEIWSMQSGWHNTAVLNGCDQKDGLSYAARDVSHEDDGRVMRLSLDMSAAYGAEACVRSMKRTLTFDRAANVITVHDELALEDCRRETALPILCAQKPEIDAQAGRVLIDGLELRFDPALFDASAEEKMLSDSKLERNWQRKSLWRLTLARREKAARDAWTLEYRQIKQ